MIQGFVGCRWSCTLILAWGLVILPQLAAGQQPVIMGPGGQPMSPDQMRAMRGGGPPPAQPGAPPTPDAKPGEEKKPEGEGDKKQEESDSVKRPDKPPRVPDPREFEVALDENGKVPQFNFIGQPWPDVMQWFATLSKCSYDWQELPNGYLNLTTQRAYSIDEVRDLINRHLHARGYTAVQTGEELRVYKLDKLDPSVVQRVTEDELYDLRPYEFVKVSFELPTGMEVDKAKEDIKQVLSPSAKVFPLVTTKRILVIDAVANLRMVSALLNEERVVQDGIVRPDEIPLKHARAEQVIDILYVVLGMDPNSRPTQMDLQLQQQKMQLMMQMQQSGKDVTPMLKKDGPPVYLAYNKQRNSVIVNAPPAEMKIIKQTIAFLDVPFGDEGESGATADIASGGGREMKKYPLTTLDPENFITTLQEIGGLSPSADFKVDKKSKILFALATESDHAKIKNLIDDFDGSGREFHVVQLQRLPADAAAETIYNLMAGQDKEEEKSNRRPYWSYWDDFGGDEEKETPVKGFGVNADIENNRLLLWANEAEMERVHGLLVKLGEIPSGTVDPRPVRFIEPASGASTAELLRQLQNVWSAAGKNELIIKLPERPAVEEPDEKPKPNDESKPEEADSNRSAAAAKPRRVRAQYAELESAAVEPEVAAPPAAESAPPPPPETTSDAIEPAAKLPPVTITVTEDGRLMLSSADLAALDQMEQLIERLAPPQRRYQVYRLKYIRALDMYWNLKDFFKEDLEEEKDSSFSDWYWGRRPSSDSNKKDGIGLAKRRKLMITYDVLNNAILVSNASTSQTTDIEQLIEEFDRPPRADSVEVRITAPIKIRYSKASVIATALKEVYRDLLSSRDKEFARGNDQQKEGRSEERATTVINYGGASQGGGEEEGRSPIKVGFEGALSIGVDEIANMLVISAQKAIFDDVVKMVHELDQEAAPTTTVQVRRVNGNVSAAALQKALNQSLGKPWIGGRPEKEPAQPTDNQNQQQGDGNQPPGDRRGGNGNNYNE